MMPSWTWDLVALAGVSSLAVGVGLIHPPLALLVLGLAAVVLALLGASSAARQDPAQESEPEQPESAQAFVAREHVRAVDGRGRLCQDQSDEGWD